MSTDWPDVKDKLFREGDPSESARVGGAPVTFQGDRYIMAYQEAAQVLIKSLQRDPLRSDLLVYPIVFCYRHHIELLLKDSLRLARRLLGKEAREDHTHDLRLLWEWLKPMMEELNLGGEPDALDAVGNQLAELAEVDPTSDTFRYPISRKGTPSFRDLRYIDLENFATVMEKLSSFLIAGCDMMDYYLTSI